MDSLQEQVSGLTRKVDVLSEAIEQLSVKLADLLEQKSPISHRSDLLKEARREIEVECEQLRPSNRSSLEHKDILIESDYRESCFQNSETQLTQEIQIQRLTAQLTAAYNRIAALEEQLLAQRIH
jgi:hypothetical protein